jgi:ribA/ribD-fused uncharacterized protein
MDIRSNSQLINYIGAKKRPKFIFFWGHKKPQTGVTKTCFSQWYGASFSEHDIRYPTAEHFMMAEKARLFGDKPTEDKILKSKTAAEAKKQGRLVIPFDENIWQTKRFEIVVKANILKFSQNAQLRAFLLATGNRVLVEASPVDKIWGIGMDVEHPHIENPRKWNGLNLLGYALMETRKQLRKMD